MGQRRTRNIAAAAVALFVMIGMVSPALTLSCYQCTTDSRPNCVTDPGVPVPCRDGEDCMVITKYDNQASPSVFDSGDSPEHKNNEVGEVEGKTNLTFLGRSCGKFHETLQTCQVGTETGKSKTVCVSYCRTDACNKGYKIDHALFLIPISILIMICLIYI